MRRNLARLVLIVVVLVALYFLGRAIYNTFFNPNRATNTQTAVVTPAPGTTATPTLTKVDGAATSTAVTATQANPLNGWVPFGTSIGGFTFRFPPTWQFSNTTPNLARGQFGTIVQSWSLTNFINTGPVNGGVPDDGIRLDFEISIASSAPNLDQMSHCSDTGVLECKNLVISGVVVRRRVVESNLRVPSIETYALYGDKAFVMKSYINIADKARGVDMVDAIVKTFAFSY